MIDVILITSTKDGEKMKINGAIFDMDGTLIDSLSFWDMAWERFGTKYLGDSNFRPSLEDEKTMRTLAMSGSMELLHEKYGVGENAAILLDEINQMIVDFYSGVVELKSGVAEFLEACYNRGIKMCVASATELRFLEIVIKRFSLEKYFETIVSCGDIGRGKEHPDVFLAAHQYLGTPKESTWIFEDSIVALKTAAAAGFNTVGIYDKYTFDLDSVKETSTVYIDKGESLVRLIDELETNK